MNKYVLEMNGYLKALQRLCKVRSDFSANSFKSIGGFEASARRYVEQLDDVKDIDQLRIIGASDFTRVLNDFIYSNLIVSDPSLRKVTEWDITEYFGLISTDVDPNGSFNVLLDDGGIELSVLSKRYKKSTFVMVKFGDDIVVLHLGIRNVAGSGSPS